MKKANENKTVKTLSNPSATVIENPVKQEKKIGKTRTVFGSGMWCSAVMNGTSSISADELKKFDETITIKSLRDLADTVYSDVATVAMLRELSANSEKEEDRENLALAVAKARKSLGAWFKTMGKRTKDDKDKPLYSVCDADLVLLGEMVADARTLSNGTVAQMSDKFFELLVIQTGRLVDGKPLERLSENDLKKAKKALNEQRKNKAAETRKANEKAKAEEEKAKAEQDEKVEKAENVLATVSNAVDFITSAIEKVMKAEMPEPAKAEILADLNNALGLLSADK